MGESGWYWVGYDIANPKRLKKVHRLMQKKGMVVQKSLFFVRGDVYKAGQTHFHYDNHC